MPEVTAGPTDPIYRTGWPANGKMWVESGEPMTYRSASGSTWSYAGIRDGQPVWVLHDDPFYATVATGEPGVLRVEFPSGALMILREGV